MLQEESNQLGHEVRLFDDFKMQFYAQKQNKKIYSIPSFGPTLAGTVGAKVAAISSSMWSTST